MCAHRSLFLVRLLMLTITRVLVYFFHPEWNGKKKKKNKDFLISIMTNCPFRYDDLINILDSFFKIQMRKCMLINI